MSKRLVRSTQVVRDFDPFSAAVSTGQLIFVSAQLPDPPGAPGGGSAAEQARRCLDNVGHQLRSAGLSLDTVTMLTVYAVDGDAAAAVGDAAAEYFHAPRPACTIVGVAWLPGDARLQIDAIAVRY